MRWPSLVVRYLLGGLIVYWLIRSESLDLNVVKAIDSRTAAMALTLAILQFVLAGWRVRVLLASAGIPVSLWRCIAYNSAGVFFSIFLPGGISGDVARAYYFWHCDTVRGAPKAALLGSLLTDRVIGSIVMILIGLIASTFIAGTLGLGVLFLAIGWLGFASGALLYMRFCRAGASAPLIPFVSGDSPWASRFAALLSNMDLRTLPRRELAFAFALSIVIHLSSIMLIFLFAELLQSGIGFWQTMGLAPFGLLVNMIPLSPGGLGIGEQGFQSLFALVGAGQGGNTFLLSRIFFSAPALLGLIVLIHSFIKAHRIIRFDEREAAETPNVGQE